MKFALIIVSIFALVVGAAQAATKSGKRQTNSAGQNAAAKSATSNPNSGRASNKAYVPAITRYDPVRQD